MGMFDTVHFSCPRCEKGIEVQSKAGDCVLRNYSQDRVPVRIAGDISGESAWCDNCKVVWRVVQIGPKDEVSMGLVRA